MDYSGHMSEPTTAPEPSGNARAHIRRFRISAVVILAVVVGLILWLVLRDSGSSSSNEKLNAQGVSITQLEDLARSVAHPVFWLGPKAGYTYELSRSSNGNIYLRYLPPGATVGTNKPYLSVATYPFGGAYAALQAIAKQRGETAIKIPRQGLAVVSSSYPSSVHVAYPGIDYQAEIFDPTAGNATALVASGKLAALGGFKNGASSSSEPVAATVGGIRSLARSLGHPVYWIGPRPGYKYELTHTPQGNVYIRYLPPGEQVGGSQTYVTVATYPFKGALAALQGLAKQKDQLKIDLPGGGLAVVNKSYPKSIHLAFPGSDYQVEVFSPSPARVRNLVSSGRVEAIG